MKYSSVCLTAKLLEEYTSREDSLKPSLYNLNQVKKEWAKTDKNIDMTQRVLHVMREAVRR